MSTLPALVLLVRTNETTSLEPLVPKYTFQLCPPTVTFALSATGFPEAS